MVVNLLTNQNLINLFLKIVWVKLSYTLVLKRWEHWNLKVLLLKILFLNLFLIEIWTIKLFLHLASLVRVCNFEKPKIINFCNFGDSEENDKLWQPCIIHLSMVVVAVCVLIWHLKANFYACFIWATLVSAPKGYFSYCWTKFSYFLNNFLPFCSWDASHRDMNSIKNLKWRCELNLPISYTQ